MKDAFRKLLDALNKDLGIMTDEGLPLKGLSAWLPTKEETEEFYKCNCDDPTKRICYSPTHRFENLKHVKVKTK